MGPESSAGHRSLQLVRPQPPSWGPASLEPAAPLAADARCGCDRPQMVEGSGAGGCVLHTRTDPTSRNNNRHGLPPPSWGEQGAERSPPQAQACPQTPSRNQLAPVTAEPGGGRRTHTGPGHPVGDPEVLPLAPPALLTSFWVTSQAPYATHTQGLGTQLSPSRDGGSHRPLTRGSGVSKEGRAVQPPMAPGSSDHLPHLWPQPPASPPASASLPQPPPTRHRASAQQPHRKPIFHKRRFRQHLTIPAETESGPRPREACPSRATSTGSGAGQVRDQPRTPHTDRASAKWARTGAREGQYAPGGAPRPLLF